MELYPKARIVTSAHPFGGIETMWRGPSAAFQTTGYDAQVLKFNRANGERAVILLADPAPALIAIIGTLPLH